MEGGRYALRVAGLRIPAELGDPEADVLAADDMAGLDGGVEEPFHLGQVADRDIVRALRLMRRATRRVWMMRPDVELDLLRAGRLGIRICRHAQEIAHESQR